MIICKLEQNYNIKKVVQLYKVDYLLLYCAFIMKHIKLGIKNSFLCQIKNISHLTKTQIWRETLKIKASQKSAIRSWWKREPHGRLTACFFGGKSTDFDAFISVFATAKLLIDAFSLESRSLNNSFQCKTPISRDSGVPKWLTFPPSIFSLFLRTQKNQGFMQFSRIRQVGEFAEIIFGEKTDSIKCQI